MPLHQDPVAPEQRVKASTAGNDTASRRLTSPLLSAVDARPEQYSV
jgi:hypothetical protein